MSVLPSPTTSPMSTPFALVQVMGRYLDRSGLKVEQAVTKDLGNPELGKAGASFVGEVVGHLEVDVVGRYQCLPRPAILDDLEQFVCDVDAEPVVSICPRTIS